MTKSKTCTPVPGRRGGYRIGAGRPTADNAKDLRTINVQLTPEAVAKAKEIGNGNVSLGIRLVLKEI